MGGTSDCPGSQATNDNDIIRSFIQVSALPEVPMFPRKLEETAGRNVKFCNRAGRRTNMEDKEPRYQTPDQIGRAIDITDRQE